MPIPKWAMALLALCVLWLCFFTLIKDTKKSITCWATWQELLRLGWLFFPNNVANPWTTINIIHLSSAFLFFTTLILFSLWLFPKTDKPEMDKQKKNRNRVYHICGYTMITCILLIILYKAWLIDFFPGHGAFQPTFWLEAFALAAFGISWITKGQMIYKDPKTL